MYEPHTLIKRRMMRATALLTLTSLLSLSSGCFGHFPMTRATHKFNVGVSDNEFLQTLTFWGLCICLVYPYSMIADLIVLNPIQFWSGNPVPIGEAGGGSGSGGVPPARPARGVATNPMPDSLSTTPDGLLRLRTTTDSGAAVSVLLKKVNDSEFSIIDDNGRKTGILRKTDNGDVVMCSLEGDVMGRLPTAGETLRGQLK